MKNNTEDIMLLQDILGVQFPVSYLKFLEEECFGKVSGVPILGFPVSLELDSVWGATEFLRAARPDLNHSFLAIWLDTAENICFALQIDNQKESPVFQINLENQASQPLQICESLNLYIHNATKNGGRNLFLSEDGMDVVEYNWFQHGMNRLDWHMKNLSFQYDHKKGGQLPRSHMWRTYRFCTQDIILGITVIHHDRRYNRLKVDVFLTAQIPEYEAESGCKALALIILSDAYKSGGSMEIKFTRHVEGGKIPRELCQLAEGLCVNLEHVWEGGITPKEAIELYMALTGLRPEVREKVAQLEKENRISAASVCYAMHHGVWTEQELEVILNSSRFPDTILKGSHTPEVWHLFHHDIFYGRNALMGGYLDRQMLRREHHVKPSEDDEKKVIELEDDERDVEISFNSECCAKIYKCSQNENPIPVPWVFQDFENFTLSPDLDLWVLLRARDPEDIKNRLNDDLDQAIQLSKKIGENSRVCIMLPADFKRLELSEIVSNAKKHAIGFILCPEFLNQLDQEMVKRFESVKVMRQ